MPKQRVHREVAKKDAIQFVLRKNIQQKDGQKDTQGKRNISLFDRSGGIIILANLNCSYILTTCMCLHTQRNFETSNQIPDHKVIKTGNFDNEIWLKEKN